MNKPLAASLTVALLCAGCVLAVSAYRSYRVFQESHGSSNHEVHLDRTGSFSVVANPPGRSSFRPGGVLQIWFTDNPLTLPGDFISGAGTVRVTDRGGAVCLDQTLSDLGVGYSSRGRFVGFPREFDTSRGGPYQIQFTISEPFAELAGLPHILSVHHFVSGVEAIEYLGKFGGSGLLLAASGFLAYKWLLTGRSRERRDHAVLPFSRLGPASLTSIVGAIPANSVNARASNTWRIAIAAVLVAAAALAYHSFRSPRYPLLDSRLGAAAWQSTNLLAILSWEYRLDGRNPLGLRHPEFFDFQHLALLRLLDIQRSQFGRRSGFRAVGTRGSYVDHSFANVIERTDSRVVVIGTGTLAPVHYEGSSLHGPDGYWETERFTFAPSGQLLSRQSHTQ